MRKLTTLFGILACAMVAGCSTMTTSINYDHSTNWSKYKTFMLADGTKDPVTFTQKKIETSVVGALTAKGWTQTTTNPDILVFTHVSLQQQKQWNAQSMGGFGYGGMRGMGGGMATATETNIPVGSLIVDLVDASAKEMIWRGVASDQVSSSGAEQGQIQDAVNALFKNFPPPPAS